MFPVLQVRSSSAEAVEYLGTKSKFWFREDARKRLFKAEERGTGEDWAEKIACELCATLELAHVHYELAFDAEQQRPGVVCDSIVGRSVHLVHGNQLLLYRDPDYPAEPNRRYRTREYTVPAVFEAVSHLNLPIARWGGALPAEVRTAPGLFCGYLMLDAWIANQDRHHENWAALWDGGALTLAPTFDHGASLARNLSDAERHERLESRDHARRIPHFARRARAALYADRNDTRPLPTFDAWRMFADHVPEPTEAWLQRLERIDRDAVQAIVDQIPPHRMSSICRRFTIDLVMENRQRLLDWRAG